MREVGELLGVVGLGAVQLPAAIVLGVALGLPAWMAAVAAGGGALGGLVVVVLVGDRVRLWVLRVLRAGPGSSADTRLRKLWERYGAWGVGVVGSLLVGVPVAAAVGVALGVSRTQLLISCAAVVAVTSLALALGLSFGWAFARSLM
ncbi:MAG: hypothetical protein GX536_07140 [Actinobacteria bacterium]|nr:hypothetical protein [Actinomycetota bacterium]